MQERDSAETHSQTAVVVLGMHRSGTSALAGALANLGCTLPAHEMKPTEDNSEGYFESSEIYRLHTRLLRSAGSSWDGWDPVSREWFAGPEGAEFHDKALTDLRQEFGNARLFILKDPRICRLLPFWREVLEVAQCRPLFVHTHRSPLQVAKSLEARDGLPPEYGLMLWLRHVIESEYASRGLPRYFTSYDRLLDDWQGVVEGLQSHLGFTLPRYDAAATREVSAFLNTDLRHFTEDNSEASASKLIPSWVHETHDILQRWASEGERAADYPALDRIRRKLDDAGEVFSGMAHVCRSRPGVQEVQQAMPESHTDMELEDSRRRQWEAETALAEHKGKISALQGLLDQAAAENRIRFTELANLSMALIRKESDIEQRDRQISDLEKSVQQHDRQRSEAAAALREKDAQIAALTADSQEQQRQLDYANALIKSLRGSKSWKLTAPLRGMARTLGFR